MARKSPMGKKERRLRRQRPEAARQPEAVEGGPANLSIWKRELHLFPPRFAERSEPNSPVAANAASGGDAPLDERGPRGAGDPASAIDEAAADPWFDTDDQSGVEPAQSTRQDPGEQRRPPSFPGDSVSVPAADAGQPAAAPTGRSVAAEKVSQWLAVASAAPITPAVASQPAHEVASNPRADGHDGSAALSDGDAERAMPGLAAHSAQPGSPWLPPRAEEVSMGWPATPPVEQAAGDERRPGAPVDSASSRASGQAAVAETAPAPWWADDADAPGASPAAVTEHPAAPEQPWMRAPGPAAEAGDPARVTFRIEPVARLEPPSYGRADEPAEAAPADPALAPVTDLPGSDAGNRPVRAMQDETLPGFAEAPVPSTPRDVLGPQRWGSREAGGHPVTSGEGDPSPPAAPSYDASRARGASATDPSSIETNPSPVADGETETTPLGPRPAASVGEAAREVLDPFMPLGAPATSERDAFTPVETGVVEERWPRPAEPEETASRSDGAGTGVWMAAVGEPEASPPHVSPEEERWPHPIAFPEESGGSRAEKDDWGMTAAAADPDAGWVIDPATNTEGRSPWAFDRELDAGSEDSVAATASAPSVNTPEPGSGAPALAAPVIESSPTISPRVEADGGTTALATAPAPDAAAAAPAPAVEAPVKRREQRPEGGAKAPIWRRELKLPRLGRTGVPRAASSDLVGLRIGSTGLGAALVHNGAGAPELLQLAHAPLERGLVVGGEVRETEALAVALRTFFAENKLPRRSVRLGIASNRIGVRVLDAPAVSDPKAFENAIRFRAQELLSIPIHDAVLDHVVLSESAGPEGPTRRVLVAFAHRELIDRYVDACRKARIRLVGIDFDAFALLRAVSGPGETSGASEGATVAVSIGHERTIFAVAEGGVCDFTRVLEWGGGSLDLGLARSLNLAPSEAAAIKHGLSLDGDGDGDAPGISSIQAEAARAAMRTELQVLARELLASLQFYQSRPGSSAISEILLTGGGAQLRGTELELERRLGVPVRIANPFRRITLGKRLAQPAASGSLSIAIGLGIEGA